MNDTLVVPNFDEVPPVNFAFRYGLSRRRAENFFFFFSYFLMMGFSPEVLKIFIASFYISFLALLFFFVYLHLYRVSSGMYYFIYYFC